MNKKNYCENQTVLITGGTKGFGKALALEFMHAGAKTVYVTHKWGSVEEDELKQEFEKEALRPPIILQSDVGDSEAINLLMKTIDEQGSPLDTIISNVAFSKVVFNLDDWKRQSLELSIKYSAWSFVELVQSYHRTTGQFPRYLIGVSSDGPDICHPGYGLVGTAKAVLETMSRYLALLLKKEGTRVNIIRPGFLDTESSQATFRFQDLDLEQMKEYFLDPRSIAKVCIALCSGLMDSVTGQIITADEGWSLVSPLSYLPHKDQLK